MNGGSGIQSSSMNSYSSSSLPPRPSSQAKSSSIHSGSSSSSHQQQESSAYTSRPPKLSQRSMSLSPSRLDEVKFREALTPVRALIRDSFNDDVMSPTSSLVIGSGRGLSGSRSSSRSEESNNRLGVGDSLNRNVRLKSPSVGRERTRDDLIDSIVYTRTREHRAMPGFRDASDWEERRKMRIDCDKLPCDPPLAVLCQDLGTSCSPMYRCVAIHSNILFTHSTSAQIIARVQNSKY